MSTVVARPAATSRPTSLTGAWPALLGLSLVFLVEMLDNTLLNVALPTIARDLHADATDLQWIVAGYSLALAGLMLLFGSLADRYGRRRVMLVGLGLFALASVAVAAVRTPGELIGVRVLIGVAAAMTAPGTMALSYRLFDDDALRVRASALISSVGMVGLAAGPVLGGLALDAVPWQVLLLVNVPVALVAGLGVRFGIPRDEPEGLHRVPLDILGAALGTATVVLALWTPTLAVQHGWTDAAPLAVGALACGAAFVVRQRRATHPLLDFSLLRRGQVAVGLTHQAALALALAGLGYTVTLQLQLAWGWSPAHAALGGLPQVLTMIAAAPLVGWVTQRLGLRRAGLAGAVAVLVGLVLYAVLARHGYLWIAAVMVLTAAGMRVVMTTSTISVLRGLPSDRTSIGAALSDTGQELGSSIGTALVGTVLAATLTGPLTGASWTPARTDSFQHAVTHATLALAAVAALLIAWTTTRSTPPNTAPPGPHPARP